jgi:hypothetical protein
MEMGGRLRPLLRIRRRFIRLRWLAHPEWNMTETLDFTAFGWCLLGACSPGFLILCRPTGFATAACVRVIQATIFKYVPTTTQIEYFA